MRSRGTSTLTAKLERNLLAYAAAASAAGLGMALAQPAKAEVIYTPAHVKLETGGLHEYFLDIDNDGVTEFGFRLLSENNDVSLLVSGITYGQHIQVSSQHRYANARKIGGKIGPTKLFDSGNMAHFMALETSDGSLIGPWANVKHRYLALSTHLKNTRTHYAWARLNVQFGQDHTTHATLTGYAYETEADKPIIAGDEGTGASLGHLALGAVGKPQPAMKRH